eukprot:CAMPEP_0172486840 /NCGR_PEP_ID=MMETSP1066-20121228/15586_1 /TAXON_ID=671091 /ORGANISM="Coscinodiscus wailesii, Strain CCMP2513" /LENGTH=205 /DNA_ID=CAMNT_0013253049 /DNA_START=200 /DNA_END=814 /DNA_ORIENTATION=-
MQNFLGINFDFSRLRTESLTGPAVAFVSVIITRTADDFTFKLLCDAFPSGMLFFFLSTASPVVLAAVLLLLTAITRRYTPDATITHNVVRPGSHATRVDDVPSSSKPETTTSAWSPWKPSRSHCAVAALDQLVTLLATAGGPRTPGYAQVVINQSTVPLTALASRVVFGRRFATLQVAASSAIVAGAVLAGMGVLSSSEEDGGDK